MRSQERLQADNFNGSRDDIRIGSLGKKGKIARARAKSDTRCAVFPVDRIFGTCSPYVGPLLRNERRVSRNRLHVISIGFLSRKRFSTAIFHGNMLQLSVNTILARDLNFIDLCEVYDGTKTYYKTFYRSPYPNWICMCVCMC